jgi:diguanylate cyclase (GGDEF)-like protein
MGKEKPAPPPSQASPDAPHEEKRSFSLSELLPWLVLLIAVTATYQLWQEARREAERALQTQFDYLVQDTTQRLRLRMQAYEQILRGAGGLFTASRHVTREEFHEYYEALNLGQNYPGIQGIGYALYLPPKEKEAHIAEMRTQGFPGYAIYPEDERAQYSSIVAIEPFSGRNLRAFGYDMFSHPVKRAAMERARNTGEIAISGKVTLVQEMGQDVQAGFLMYLPIYRHGTLNRTIEERRANLVGWVYAPFRMRDLMTGFNAEQYVGLDLAIYDGRETTDAALLYEGRRTVSPDAEGALYVKREVVQIRNREWTVVAVAPPGFGQEMDNDRATIMLKAGVAMSMLLTLLTWLLVAERARAWRAADHAYRLALYDPLTRLPNRKLFNDRLQHALAQAKRGQARIAVMFIDLDKFKPVNDNFGHEIGDLLLQQVAERLAECVRESDTVARVGGDEFVVLLAGGETENGESVVAEKIRIALSSPFHVAGYELRVACSIGIAIYPDHGNEEKLLLRHADTAMYHAKQEGRNRVRFYDPHMSEAVGQSAGY